jgi:beta-phosphoglucomutase-like phosphatase (HAD superfamily)
MRFDGLIFDLDGVLVDTVPVQIEVWSETFAQFGYDFDEAAYRLLVDGRPALDGDAGRTKNSRDTWGVRARQGAARIQVATGSQRSVLANFELREVEGSLAWARV